MATTVSRRSEGFHSSQHKHTRRAHREQQYRQHELPPSPAARMKRPLDPIDNLTDPLKPKRTRIAVEIYARPLAQALSPPKPILVRRQLSTTHPVAVASTEKPEGPSPTTNPLPSAPTLVPTPLATAATNTAATTAPHTQAQHHHPTAISKTQGPPRHREKAINGIRHELDRLQPNVAGTSSAIGPPGRKLRSQEATRFKSELSAYFPEYDEVIGNDPPKEQRTSAQTSFHTYYLPSSATRTSALTRSTPLLHSHQTHTAMLTLRFIFIQIFLMSAHLSLSSIPILDLRMLRRLPVTMLIVDIP